MSAKTKIYILVAIPSVVIAVLSTFLTSNVYLLMAATQEPTSVANKVRQTLHVNSFGENFGPITWIGWRPESEDLGILYEQDAPLILKVRGQLVPDWNLADLKENTADNNFGTVWELHNLPLKELLEKRLGHEWRNSSADAASQPVSPVERAADEPIVDFEMIPYACARLRVTELPVLCDHNCQKK